MIRVYLIAQAIAIRAGLNALLADDQRIDIIGEASIPADEDFKQIESDVVIWSPASISNYDTLISDLMNIPICETAGLLLIHDEPKVIEALSKLKVRAWGMLSPEFSQAELLAAIVAINEGLIVANPIWMQYLSAGRVLKRYEDSEMIEALTGREVEILQLLALGLTNKQIALRLGISSHTVKFHISSIFTKMGTTNRTETVQLGLTKGLIVL